MYISEYWNVGEGETGNSELIPEYVTHIKDLPFPEKVENFRFVYDIISECCKDSKCINSFNNLGVRFVNAKKYPLVYSHIKFCADCGFPNKTSTQQEIVEDYIEDVFNLDGFRSYTDCPVQTVDGLFCYAKCFDRQQKRINGVVVRRNVLNVAVFIPKLNCFFVTHQTFRYRPRGTTVSGLLHMLIPEALLELKNSIRVFSETFHDYTCKCM